MCLAFKTEEASKWEQISFVTTRLRDVAYVSDNVKVVHSITEDPVV